LKAQAGITNNSPHDAVLQDDDEIVFTLRVKLVVLRMKKTDPQRSLKA
jgi:hypothetical protein